jgi:hypothetical protein
MSRSAPTLVSPRRFARLTVLLLALVAFGAQQWAVRTHWHAVPGTTAGLHAAGEPAGVSEEPSDSRGQPHPGCLWCQAAAHASAAAPPSQWGGLPAVTFHSYLRPSAGATAEFLPPLSWAWHSRGPPAA